MERSRMSLDWLVGYELRRGWRGPSPNIVVVVVAIHADYISPGPLGERLSHTHKDITQVHRPVLV